MIDATCEHLLILDGKGKVSVHHATYTEWHDRQSPAGEPRRQVSPPREPQVTDPPEPPKTEIKKSKHSWMKLEQVEAKISELEAQIAELDASLADPEVWREPDRANELTERRDRLKDQLAEFEAEWLRKAE